MISLGGTVGRARAGFSLLMSSHPPAPGSVRPAGKLGHVPKGFLSPLTPPKSSSPCFAPPGPRVGFLGSLSYTPIYLCPIPLASRVLSFLPPPE